MNDLWPALLLSLRVALVATGLVALIGVPLAFASSRVRWPGKGLVETFLTLPLVLPPTVVGYGLIVLFGRRGWIGSWLDRAFGYSIIFNWHGAVIAAAVVAFPLLYLPAKAAFSGIDPDLIDTARMMGAGRAGLFWHVGLPLARRGIASGLILAFARALGEFGATAMVLGIQSMKPTLPIFIYEDTFTPGSQSHALAAVLLLTGVSWVVLLVYAKLERFF